MANLQMGDTALAFQLPGIDDRRYTLSELSEGKKATVVIFMCNHCPYVLAWLDRLTATATEYATKDVAFVGINANDPVKYPADSYERMQQLALSSPDKRRVSLTGPQNPAESRTKRVLAATARTPFPWVAHSPRGDLLAPQNVNIRAVWIHPWCPET